jgi:GNAT superfamily N-acetyltransferase
MQILPLRSEDRESWAALFALYFATFDRVLPDAVTAACWERIHDPAVPVHGLAAWDEGVMVGFVLYLVQPTTRSVASHCYLSDLFTHEAARGRGAGTALVRATFDEARRLGCNRVYWMTQQTNEKARRIYDKLAVHSGLIEYRHALD